MWIRRDNAFPAIVDSELYKEAEAIAVKRVRRYTDGQLLQMLRDFLKLKGKLTAKSIRSDVDMPCPQAYNARFGSFVEA